MSDLPKSSSQAADDGGALLELTPEHAAPPPSAGSQSHGAAPDPETLHSEGRIFSVLSQFAVMQIVLAASGIVRNKIVAYRLGPAAFGEIVQIAAVTATIGTLVSFGMGVGISRNSARAGTPQQRQEQLASANAMVLSLAMVACMITTLLLITGRFLPIAGLTQTTAAVIAAAMFIVAIPIDALKSNYLAFLQGILDVKGLAIRRSVAVLLATVTAVPVVWLFGFVGAAVQFLLLSSFVAALLGFRVRKLGYLPLQVRPNRQLIAQLASFGLVSLTSAFAQSLADTAVRASLIQAVGAAANGLVQAAYVLAQTLRGIVLTSIGSISLATIARQKGAKEMSASVERLLNVVVPLATCALGLLGLGGSHALTILYSSAFAPGAALFPFLLAGDLVMAFVWVIGATLLSHADRVLWVSLELLYAFTRWAVAILLLDRFGPVAVAIGYFAAVFTHSVLNYSIVRLRYHIEVKLVHVARVLLGAGFIAALSYVGSRQVSPAVYAAAALAWFVYSFVVARRTLLPEFRRRVSSRK